MFHSTRIGTRMVRRLTAMFMVGGLLLTIAAAPVSAQTFVGDGKVFATVDCNLATHKATITVNALNPTAYSTGLYYYVRVWAKDRIATAYSIIGEAPTGLVITQYSSGPYSWPVPAALVNASFVGGRDHMYDVYVQYWFRTPGGAWSSMGGFRVQDDLGQFGYLGLTSQSTFTRTSNSYGALSSPAIDCQL